MRVAQRKLSPEARGYGPAHRALRERLAPFVLAGRVQCARCGEPILPGQEWDLGHDDADRSRYTGPEHRHAADCPEGGNRSTSGRVNAWRPPRAAVSAPEPERDGVPASDPCWDVPWLRSLLSVPDDAVWPRLMTVPHPRATGSFGDDFCAFARERSGQPLRWWQQLVATRLLEHDADGRLVWESMILSLARQLGKSWLLRELMLWRIHQGERFGEPQDCLHTGKDIAICKEVQRPARMWARAQPKRYRVREVNGQEEIEFLADGSRWMLRAKEAVYGYSVSCAAADEAWKVKASSIEEGLTPTMAERRQPQLLLVSTAHRLATTLMLSRRQAALSHLDTGAGDLLIEWSAPRGCALDAIDGWRLASPHWTPRRQRLVARQLDMLRAGEIDDPEEPDPEQSFRAQWLNQWPQRVTDVLVGDPLLEPGRWGELTEQVTSSGPVFVAVEDDFGLGAAVAAACLLDDGRIEVDGWLCPDWDSAIQEAIRLAEFRRVRQLLVGASLLSRVPPGTVPAPIPAGTRETRLGLALLRDLVASGDVIHDETTFQLDEAVVQAQVKESLSGLQLVPGRGPTHLVRALVWAVNAAHKPAPVPAIY